MYYFQDNQQKFHFSFYIGIVKHLKEPNERKRNVQSEK